ncbi:MAG TPA: ATP-binding protein, partial [Spirochaetota bacterium]|nr:ATP-binding protein [Spirochaetota bacterium]
FDEIPPVMADKQKIYQLLANLLTNARHAIIPKGIGHINVSLVNDNNFIKIIIVDDGIGLSTNQIDHIFEPFYMNKSTSNTGNSKNSEIRGTGLGLPVCDVIAKQHGGSITVKSGSADGTIFTVSLPKKFAQVFSGVSGLNWKKNAKLNPVKVLVVDDEMAIREIIYRALCNLDTETYLAANMKELQDMIMDHVFDVIFLDYLLPEMTADRILPILRDKFPAARIVMISGWNGSPRKKAQLEKTVDAWIDKPFNVELIIDQLSIFRNSII